MSFDTFFKYSQVFPYYFFSFNLVTRNSISIISYSGGRNPWRNEAGAKQNYSDGKIEVVGFHTLDFMFLQIGRPGDRICQASKVRFRTKQQIPMQIGVHNLILKASH